MVGRDAPLLNRRDRLIARARQGYRLAYGVEPSRFVAAPGRINLIGEHADYTDGYALACAIDRETIVAAGPPAPTTREKLFEVVALDMGDMASARDRFDLVAPIRPGENNWQNHVRGVVQALGRYGQRVRPMRIAISGDVPMGTGLSSSAAFGVAVALACSDYCGLGLSPDLLAKAAQLAEQDFAGTASGITAQLASAASLGGHALLVDCSSMGHMAIPIHPDLAITAIDTGVRRDPAIDIVAARRAECAAAAEHFAVKTLREVDAAMLLDAEASLDPMLLARARHVVGEAARIEWIGEGLVRGDTALLAEVMHEAQLSLAQDFAASLPQIDQLTAMIAEALGDAGGVRLSDAGPGGCLVAISSADATGAIDEALARYNRTATGVPARAQRLHPSAGAAPIELE